MFFPFLKNMRCPAQERGKGGVRKKKAEEGRRKKQEGRGKKVRKTAEGMEDRRQKGGKGATNKRSANRERRRVERDKEFYFILKLFIKPTGSHIINDCIRSIKSIYHRFWHFGFRPFNNCFQSESITFSCFGGF